jgi:hypothetical protein
MWQSILTRLLGSAAAQRLAGGIRELNAPEVYADRIKRDMHLRDYADAWALYSSDPKYWERYYAPPAKPDWNDELVHDSAAAAGVPSRYNVFEYGFPQPSADAARVGAAPLERSLRRGTGNVGVTSEPPVRFLPGRPSSVPGDGMTNWSTGYANGNAMDGRATSSGFSGRVSPVPYVPQAPQSTSVGIPGMIAAATGNTSSDPTWFQPPAGGLLGMIQDYMRSNPGGHGQR